MSTPSLNTLSYNEAMRICKNGSYTITKIIKIDTFNINKIIEEYNIKKIDFLNIDIEGMDYKIISEFNFEKIQPSILCVETIDFNESLFPKKNEKLIDTVCRNGYMIYADTFINTIFVKNPI